MRNVIRCLLVVSALGLFSRDAAAAPILWTLNGVTVTGFFGGTGTVTGSFVFDADTGIYSNLAITSTLPNASFDTSDVGGAFGATAGGLHLVTNFGLADLTNQATLLLGFTPPLSNAGGNVTVGGTSGRCTNPSCHGIQVSTFPNVDIGGTISGSLTGTPLAVPEPTSLLLLGTGLGISVWRRRRRA